MKNSARIFIIVLFLPLVIAALSLALKTPGAIDPQEVIPAPEEQPSMKGDLR